MCSERFTACFATGFGPLPWFAKWIVAAIRNDGNAGWKKKEVDFFE
jgi:hypothetical protein